MYGLYLTKLAVVQKKVSLKSEEYMYSAINKLRVNHVFTLTAVAGVLYLTLVFMI